MEEVQGQAGQGAVLSAPATDDVEPQSHGLRVRGARASSVIVQNVPKARVDGFLAWQRGITQEARRFAGYQGTEIFPPVETTDDQWAVIVHFDDADSLAAWIASPVRKEWVAKLAPEIALVGMKTLGTGFGPWFGNLGDAAEPPAPWKMVLTVLLALYPTVMLLALIVLPHTAHLGLAVSLLINNAISCVVLQWPIMPLVERLLRPWLRANGPGGRNTTILGTIAIVATLAALASLFRTIAS